ncbi:UvrD-helicase domain-containing protein [Planctobacterium marinum]|uniref:UvrD-helicase domain-containing protein n=1 Tax=Planctobacterium marinum TaxID=1631968 RepID=UPI001E4F6BBD|nr:ATP-dependent helicase [Planctobacterium marinum]MCC2607552.1 ATP-dependent helicase [Planctobacterium marinum]
MTNSFIPTPDQQAAIDSNANMVITACPGSGKTSIVVHKIRKEIPEIGNHRGVIGITFTVKASKELKRKCKKDGFNTKRSFFGTIDHFCLSEIIFPFAKRMWGPADSRLECITYDELDEGLKTKLPPLSDAGVVLSTNDYDQYEDEFIQQYKNGIVLLEAVGILANHILNNSIACQRYISARYTSLYVDEYQDSSQAQHKLFLSLLQLGLRAVAVGDVQQSIYAWRGSSPEYINELISLPEVFEHHIVNINHRCHPSITNYANRLFSESANLLPVNEIRVFRRVFNGTQIDLANELNTYLPQTAASFGVTNLSEIAILVRNNRSLDYLISELNIPHRVYNDDPLGLINTRASNLFSDLLRYRYDSAFLSTDIDAVREYESRCTRAELARVRSEIVLVRSIGEQYLEEAILGISRELLGGDVASRDIDALKVVINSTDALSQYAPSNDSEVQVMTLHKSKGLEFEIVFHLDLYDWVFPYREYTGDFNDEIYPSWDQDLNLHYVGITRAKTACILARSTRRLNNQGQNRQGQNSAFLELNGLGGLYA